MVATKHPLYWIWRDMLKRCYSKAHSQHKNYGDRGIAVCVKWREPGDGFWGFVADMGTRPDGRYPSGLSRYSLDRINNDGNYEPGNCRWATQEEQMANRRPGLSPSGETHSCAKLQEIDVVYALCCLGRGVRPEAIARRVDCSPATIYAIRNGQKWKRVSSALVGGR